VGIRWPDAQVGYNPPSAVLDRLSLGTRAPPLLPRTRVRPRVPRSEVAVEGGSGSDVRTILLLEVPVYSVLVDALLQLSTPLERRIKIILKQLDLLFLSSISQMHCSYRL